jgi:hypothetical protein
MLANHASEHPESPANIPTGLLTIPVFCRAIGKSSRTFARMRKAGKVPPIIRIGSTPYIRVVDMENWIASLQPIVTRQQPLRRRRVRRRAR